jgi:HK97 family phage portal protein
VAFKIFDWLLKRAGTDDGTQSVTVNDFLDNEIDVASMGIEVYIRRMAFWSVVRKIGAAVGAVEWETYRRGKKVRSKEFWSWNYDPNPNQNREQFFSQLIGELYLNQEALIVETRQGYRYVADSYSVDKHLNGDVYEGIMSHEEEIPGRYRAQDILKISLTGDSINGILSGIMALEGKLLKCATKSYIKTHGKHAILHIDDTAEAEPDFEETYSDLVNNKFKKYFESENAVLPLFKGYELQDDRGLEESTKANLTGTRDIRHMMDDIVELTARSMGVPESIATGRNVTDADIKTFISDVVRPIVMSLAQEINRKTYGKELVYNGSYISPDLSNVRYSDIFDVANPIDKLIGSGAFSVNDIRTRLGLEVIDEPWADQHWMTKNYSPADELMEQQGNTTQSTKEADNGTGTE